MDAPERQKEIVLVQIDADAIALLRDEEYLHRSVGSPEYFGAAAAVAGLNALGPVRLARITVGARIALRREQANALHRLCVECAEVLTTYADARDREHGAALRRAADALAEAGTPD